MVHIGIAVLIGAVILVIVVLGVVMVMDNLHERTYAQLADEYEGLKDSIFEYYEDRIDAILADEEKKNAQTLFDQDEL